MKGDEARAAAAGRIRCIGELSKTDRKFFRSMFIR